MSGSEPQGNHGRTGNLAQDYRGALRNVADVIGVSLLDEGKIQVISRSGKSPRVLARDVKTVLLTTLGQSVADGSIDVVQVGGTDESSSRDVRATLGSLEVKRSGSGVEARVFLSLGRRTACGEVQGTVGRGEEEILALATLEAMQELLGGAVQLHLVAHRTVTLSGHKAQLSVVEWFTPDDSMILLGSSLVRRSQAEAAVKSVLDALNRFVSWFPA